MTLFQRNTEPLHSGGESWFKIDCDALTDEDVEVLAGLMAERVRPFSEVEGVPRGGLRLAAALEHYCTPAGGLLICDDVLSTGASMEEHRAGRKAQGVVAFCRGSCPLWVVPIFNMPAMVPVVGAARVRPDLG